MKRLLLLLALPFLAQAHMVSLSSGQLDITGAEARLTLRIPAYELPQGESMLDNAYSIAGATLRSRSCAAESDQLVCRYEFTAVPAKPRVQCRFAEVLVANHVHVLTAQRDGAIARQVFSGPTTEAELRFGAGADPVEAILDGLRQAFSGWGRLLLLFTIGFAARRRQEALAFTAALAVGLITSLAIAFPASPRFVEAAAAIGVGYLAFEVLMLADAGYRWVAVGAVGLLLGIGIPTGAPIPYYATTVAASLLPVGLLGLLTLAARPFAKALSVLLLVIAVAWFGWQFLPAA
jgi:hypothetical protein